MLPLLGFVFRKFDEKMSSGLVLLDVGKVFDRKWIERLPYKLANLDFEMYLLKSISYLHSRTFQISFLSATSARSSMWLEWLRMDLCSPILFQWCVEGRTSTFSCLSARMTRPSKPHSHVLPVEVARRLHAGLSSTDSSTGYRTGG